MGARGAIVRAWCTSTVPGGTRASWWVASRLLKIVLLNIIINGVIIILNDRIIILNDSIIILNVSIVILNDSTIIFNDSIIIFNDSIHCLYMIHLFCPLISVYFALAKAKHPS